MRFVLAAWFRNAGFQVTGWLWVRIPILTGPTDAAVRIGILTHSQRHPRLNRARFVLASAACATSVVASVLASEWLHRLERSLNGRSRDGAGLRQGSCAEFGRTQEAGQRQFGNEFGDAEA